MTGPFSGDFYRLPERAICGSVGGVFTFLSYLCRID